MFTIKFYSADGYRQVIKEAESFTVLRGDGGTAEITLHQKNMGEDSRYDIKSDHEQLSSWSPPCFGKAIIENSAGRTTEIITLPNGPVNAIYSEPKAYGISAGGDANKFKVA